MERSREKHNQDIAHDPRLIALASEHPYPLLFASVSGSHLYGFSSPDSDVDLRGVHILPPHELLGLKSPQDTIGRMGVEKGIDLDLVTHDVGKFFVLLLKKNGLVLEQLHSPLIVVSREEFQELREISLDLITRHHMHHYRGFARGEWRELERDAPPRVKRLLYVFRALLTGIHLMRTGNVEANLPRLAADAGLDFIDELIERKVSGEEKTTLEPTEIETYRPRYLQLVEQLETASERSHLPDEPMKKDQMSDFLVRIRMQFVDSEYTGGRV